MTATERASSPLLLVNEVFGALDYSDADAQHLHGKLCQLIVALDTAATPATTAAPHTPCTRQRPRMTGAAGKPGSRSLQVAR